MGCWWEPADNDQFRDFAGFVLESERARYDEIFDKYEDIVYEGNGTDEQDEAVNARLVAMNRGESSFWDLSYRDQRRLASELAYEDLRAEQAVAPAIVEPAAVEAPVAELVSA